MVTGWPWRSLGYLLTTPAVVMLGGLPLSLLGLPWIALLEQLTEGGVRWPLGTVVLVVLLGAVLVAVGGPLVGLPVAVVERVVLAEDGVLLREGLAGLLGRFGFEVVAAVGDAEALAVAVAEHTPDLACGHRHPDAADPH